MDAVMESNSALDRLKGTISKLALSISDIARMSGKSTGTISQVLNGKYKGRSEVVDEILASVEESAAPAKEPDRGLQPWLTAGEEIIEGILKLTYYNRGFTAIVGASGLGKTFTAQHFIQSRSDVAYARCTDGMSMGDTITMLLDLAGVTTVYGTKTQKMKRAINALKEQGIKMIIIDEADLLVSDGNKPLILKKISVFREAKEAGIAVAMVGLPSFDNALRVVGETYVTSRLDYFRHVPTTSYEELAYYLASLGYDPETPEAKLAISMAPKRGALRLIEKLSQTGKFFGNSLKEAIAVTFASSGHIKEV